MQSRKIFLRDNKLLIATGNKGKKAEIESLLNNHNIKLYSLKDFKIKEPEETGLSFVENAILKARNGAKNSNMPCLADDSGLMVDLLNGEPGIYSARYSEKNDGENQNISNINKLIHEIKKSQTTTKNFTARFVCVLAFVKDYKDPCPIIIQKFWEGIIKLTPEGDNGFGYDPIFFIPEIGKTAAQLTKVEKQKISHRGLALKEFINLLEA